jgi:hypothetical protein
LPVSLHLLLGKKTLDAEILKDALEHLRAQKNAAAALAPKGEMQ